MASEAPLVADVCRLFHLGILRARPPKFYAGAVGHTDHSWTLAKSACLGRNSLRTFSVRGHSLVFAQFAVILAAGLGPSGFAARCGDDKLPQPSLFPSDGRSYFAGLRLVALSGLA